MSRALPAYALPLLEAECASWRTYRAAIVRALDPRVSNRPRPWHDASADPHVREFGARWRAARDELERARA